MRSTRSGSTRTATVLAAGFLLSLVLAAAGTATAAEQVTVDGVLHVRNGAKPSGGVRTLALQEIWRAGGEDDEESIFGLITRVVADPAGNVYLLDTQLHQVHVFDSKGAFTRTLSREGEGPGEVRYPVDMLFMPDGTLGLVQTFPGRIVCVDLQDNPAKTFVPGGDAPAEGGFLTLSDVQGRAGRLVLGGVESTINQTEGFQVRDNFIRSYAADGKPLVTYAHKSRKYEFSKLSIDEETEYFPQFRKWVLGNDGRVYVASQRNTYAIDVYAPDGKLERVIERQYVNWNRTPDEHALVESIMTAQLRNIPFPVEHSVSKTEETINSMMLGDDGNLWVLSSRGWHEQPAGILATYDVFTPAGDFVEQVRVSCPGDGSKDALMEGGKGRFVVVKGFTDAMVTLQTQGAAGGTEEGEEPAPMEIICYGVK